MATTLEGMNPSDFISVRDAAGILGCTQNTLRVCARRGKMTIARWGTGFNVMLLRSEVEHLRLNPPKQGWPKGKPRGPRRARIVPTATASTATSTATAE
jgi:hypothetical protein